MQYLHDNLKMHTIYEGKIQYSHYDHNTHYVISFVLWMKWDENSRSSQDHSFVSINKILSMIIVGKHAA